MKITYHGHSCFELSNDDSRVLIDPFLKPNNPKAITSAEEVEPTHILLTHGHVDHCADVREIAERTDCQVLAMVEIAEWFSEQGLENLADPNLGGTVEYDWGWVKLVPAFHTNTLPDGSVVGQAAGLVISFDGTIVYHLGDTCLFGDLKLIGQRHDVDVAIVPIGGHYTMDREDAVLAAEWVGADTVIPCHYGTFEAIETDVEAFESECEGDVVVLDIGDTHDLSSGETESADGSSLEEEEEYETQPADIEDEQVAGALEDDEDEGEEGESEGEEAEGEDREAEEDGEAEEDADRGEADRQADGDEERERETQPSGGSGGEGSRGDGDEGSQGGGGEREASSDGGGSEDDPSSGGPAQGTGRESFRGTSGGEEER